MRPWALFALALFACGRHGAVGASRAPIIPPSWLTPAWYIDPLSAVATCSDANAGTSSGAPLCTWHELNDGRWGCAGAVNCPRLTQTTTVTWLSSAPASDMVYLHPGMENGAFLVLTTPLPTPRCSGTLAGVLNIVRPAGSAQLTNATLCAGAAVGDLVIDTTHPSRARVYQNVTGNTWALTAPMIPMAVPPTVFVTPAAVAWSNGDAYADYPPLPAAYFAEVKATSGARAVAYSSVVDYQLGMAAVTSTDVTRVNTDFMAVDAYVTPILRVDDNGGVTYAQYYGDVLAGGMKAGGPASMLQCCPPLFLVAGQLGLPGQLPFTNLDAAILDDDIIVTGYTYGGDDFCHAAGATVIHSVSFGAIYLDTNATLQGDRSWGGFHSVNSALHTLWGPGNWSLWGSGHFALNGGAAQNLQNTGFMKLNCATNACNGGLVTFGGATVLPTTCNIPITEANVATYGTLWIPGGASVSVGY